MPSALRPAGSCATGTTAWSCPPATAPRSRGAIVRLAGDAALRERLGAAGAEDVRAFSHDAWARGFSRALATVGLSRGRW